MIPIYHSFGIYLHMSDERIYEKILKGCYGLELIELNDINTINQARELNLVKNLDKTKHVITSPFIRETAEIFTKGNLGRMICFYRHPIDYDLHPVLPTFEVRDNWLTRLLSNEHKEELTFNKLGIAKHVVRQSCLVGSLTTMKPSIVRIAIHLNWHYANDMSEGEGEKCIDDALLDNPAEKWADHTTVKLG